MLRAEKLDGKTLIHNYGHGGSGMSLSWGTGQMAAELALEQPDRRAAVIGCGVVGLTTARQLQRRGFDVTIYAATVPPDTTSNMSLAGFTPTSGWCANAPARRNGMRSSASAVEIAYRQLQLLAGPKYGISWIHNYSPTDDEPQVGAAAANPLLPDSVRTGDGRARARPASVSDPLRDRARRDAHRAVDLSRRARAGRHRARRPDRHPQVRDAARLADARRDVIVNCTGLGAKALFSDPELMPLKGQLIVLIPQEDVNYSTNGGVRIATRRPASFVHMMPRRDGIVLGGTSERDVWTTEIDEAERKRVVEGHMQLFSAFRQGAHRAPA